MLEEEKLISDLKIKHIHSLEKLGRLEKILKEKSIGSKEEK